MMNKSKLCGIFLIITGMLTSHACDQKNDVRLSQELLKPAIPKYNTEEYLAAEGSAASGNRSQTMNQINQAASLPPAPLLLPPPIDPPFPPYATGGAEEDYFAREQIPLTAFGVPFAVCGNGIVEPAEQCDDGNLDNRDGCNVLCRFPHCGNGLLEKFEACDDNNNLNGDGCASDCIYEYCGNFRLETEYGEQCDDGNRIAGDGCSPCCQYEECSNGSIDPGEQCDDGNADNGDGCSDCCLFENPPTG